MRALARFLGSRSAREQVLLTLLALVVLPLALVYLWLLPLHQARLAAENDLAEARALAAWVAEEAAAFEAAGGAGAGPGRDAVGIAGIERSLGEAGLRDGVGRLEDGEAGRIALSFDAVPFTGLAGFAATVQTDLGYRIEGLRLDATDQTGIVAASLELAPLP